MPIYEYLCESCGKVNERLQKVGDPPPRDCDECGSRKLAKLVSRSAFQLKGGGWYSDLYASRKKEPRPAEAGGAPPKGDAPKAESTPGTKTTDGAAAPATPKPSPAGAGEGGKRGKGGRKAG
jgi:putative FmdB family regulatory protein